MFLLKDTFKNILSFINPACPNKANLAHVFLLRKAHHSLLVLRTANSTSALHLGTILNCKITNEKQNNMKNEALNKSQKRTIVDCIRN